jgi:hypothetical protein
MSDRLRDAGVSKADRQLVLGHSSGEMSEAYGGPEARLRAAARAVEKVSRR